MIFIVVKDKIKYGLREYWFVCGDWTVIYVPCIRSYAEIHGSNNAPVSFTNCLYPIPTLMPIVILLTKSVKCKGH